MLFVKSDDLKPGMRLAKPIYNKNGVLLYDRNTKLSEQGVYSIKNFGLIGIYILEPAEPLPPMTEDDIEFERFQTMSIFMLKDDLDLVIKGKETKNIDKLVFNIISKYGRLNRKISFIQNLRSKDDYTYKHSLNVAILCALIGNRLNLSQTEKTDLVLAGLYHDIGKLMIPKAIINKGENLTEEDKERIKKCELEGFNLLNYESKLTNGAKSIITKSFRDKLTTSYSSNNNISKTVLIGTKVLKVANDFDKLTAMSIERGPSSEIAAIRMMLAESDKYDETIVKALLNSINILVVGTTVELTNFSKGIVLVENKEDVLRPIVLDFASNGILDLNDSKVFKDVQIKDIMKTMDNRHIVDKELLNEFKSGLSKK